MSYSTSDTTVISPIKTEAHNLNTTIASAVPWDVISLANLPGNTAENRHEDGQFLILSSDKCISPPPFFGIEIIYRTITINGGLFFVIFCLYTDTVILDDTSVLILCFMTYRLLSFGRPFQESPQNVFVSRLAQYRLWKRYLKGFSQKWELSFNYNVRRVTLTRGSVWEGLGHIIQTISGQFDFFLLVIFNPPYWTQTLEVQLFWKVSWLV